MRPAALREVTRSVQQKFDFSERRACQVTRTHRSTMRRDPKSNEGDQRLLASIRKIVAENPRYGAPRVYTMLRRAGNVVNHKRVERVYYENGLKLSTRPPKRKRRRPLSELPKPSIPGEKWSLDFVHDNLADGRSIRVLTVIDEFTRECVAMEVDTSLGGQRLVHTMTRISVDRKLPIEFGLDQGPEFTSTCFLRWAKEKGIGVSYCSPGNKNENAFIESFNGRLRDECLNMNWFSTLSEARQIIEHWRVKYNTERPHSSLGGLTPQEFSDQVRNGKAA